MPQVSFLTKFHSIAEVNFLHKAANGLAKDLEVAESIICVSSHSEQYLLTYVSLYITT